MMAMIETPSNRKIGSILPIQCQIYLNVTMIDEEKVAELLILDENFRACTQFLGNR